MYRRAVRVMGSMGLLLRLADEPDDLADEEVDDILLLISLNVFFVAALMRGTELDLLFTDER